MLALGIDVITTGNHIWNQRPLLASIAQEPRLIRPLNYPKGTPGNGFYVHALPDGRSLLVANLMGNLFMKDTLDDPFAVADAFFNEHRLGYKVHGIFLDFHGEATSEKMALAHFLDGRVSAIVGTHTHLPTADCQILPEGTAFQGDAGMCGDFNSVIGVKKENALWRFTKKIPGPRLEPAEGEGTVCGTFLVTDDATGKATSITNLRAGGRLPELLPL
jgi:metallophosphoesterase (TIGR00282 family)